MGRVFVCEMRDEVGAAGPAAAGPLSVGYEIFLYLMFRTSGGTEPHYQPLSLLGQSWSGSHHVVPHRKQARFWEPPLAVSEGEHAGSLGVC